MSSPRAVDDDDAESRLSVGEEVLGSLLEASHGLHPDDLAAVVVDHAARLGATDAVIYLVDHEQSMLVPLPTRPGEVAGDGLEIDTTLAGRVYRTQEVAYGDAEGGVRLWLPLLDGSERLGVLAATLRSVDPVVERRVRWLTSLVAELLMTKHAYGDAFVWARRRRDMSLAAEMRWMVLPPLSFTSSSVEIAAVLEPAYEVAGDSFDYAVDDGVAHLAIFDAMGHGLEAARMANLAVGAYRHGRRRQCGLVDMFASVDAAIRSQFGVDHFVTGQLAILDLATGALDVVNGGHPRPLLLRGTAILRECASAVSPPMGLGSSPTVTRVQLEPEDRVVFYTDGVVEARSPTGEEFGVERLGDLLSRAAASRELPAEMMRRLTHSLLAHEAGRLRDDATLLLVGWKGPAGRATAVEE
ncbi:MAG: SpoIIE family protein phosphatase [Actinomycetota bacterium]|nr:SpoIIE family protein phosphatase [Actinomycetota bacterium]